VGAVISVIVTVYVAKVVGLAVEALPAKSVNANAAPFVSLTVVAPLPAVADEVASIKHSCVLN
jgi:hypothetical protein